MSLSRLPFFAPFSFRTLLAFREFKLEVQQNSFSLQRSEMFMATSARSKISLR